VERQDRFSTPSPWFSLDGNILEETKDKLYFISRRIEKLSRYAGEIFEDGDGYDIDALADSDDDDDVRWKWEIKRLRHLNVQLYHLIGSLLGVKKEVLDSLERLKMAQLERSHEKELEAKKSRVNAHAADELGKVRTKVPEDWQPDDDSP
jgi:hypothetical protein